MSHPAYYGRPALVARYRPRAPLSVHVVALIQYLGGLLVLAAAGVAGLIVRGVPEHSAMNLTLRRIPASIRDGLAGGGLVIAIALAVLGLCWLVVARNLQRGRPWARATVVVLSLLSAAITGYRAWLGHDSRLLAGVAVPVLCLILLNTQNARFWFRHGTW